MKHNQLAVIHPYLTNSSDFVIDFANVIEYLMNFESVSVIYKTVIDAMQNFVKEKEQLGFTDIEVFEKIIFDGNFYLAINIQWDQNRKEVQAQGYIRSGNKLDFYGFKSNGTLIPLTEKISLNNFNTPKILVDKYDFYNNMLNEYHVRQKTSYENILLNARIEELEKENQIISGKKKNENRHVEKMNLGYYFKRIKF